MGLEVRLFAIGYHACSHLYGCVCVVCLTVLLTMHGSRSVPRLLQVESITLETLHHSSITTDHVEDSFIAVHDLQYKPTFLFHCLH